VSSLCLDGPSDFDRAAFNTATEAKRAQYTRQQNKLYGCSLDPQSVAVQPSSPASLPRYASGQRSQHLRAKITELRVRGVHIDASKGAIRRLVPTSNAARVHDGRRSRSAPRREVIPIVVTTTCGVDIDGAVVGIAHGRLYAVALVAHDAIRSNFIAPDSCRWVSDGAVSLPRDWAARAAVAVVAAYRAPVAEPCAETAGRCS
jgi:hypothetical protein